MVRCLSFLMLLGIPFWGFTQDFNEPDEILRIMEKSSMRYQLHMGPEQVAEPFAIGPENVAFTYAKREDGQSAIATYDFDAVSAPLYNDAEADFAARRYAAARGKYLEIHELRPDIGVVATFIGQTYAEEGNPTEAIKWYQASIAGNFHGFLAHWLLAEEYLKLKQFSQAATEITLAWILNRNSAHIRASVTKIFKADKRNFLDFDFEPNYLLGQDGKQVTIAYAEDWMLYAFCKALWAYEPGYHRELGGGRNAFDMTEEKECLLNLAMGYSRIHKGKLGKNVAINTLISAIQAKMVNEFIFMEEWLRMEPIIVYTQPQEAILALVDYVLQVRAPRK
jgi:tetratricopeptide (TPR) repeat protein